MSENFLRILLPHRLHQLQNFLIRAIMVFRQNKRNYPSIVFNEESDFSSSFSKYAAVLEILAFQIQAVKVYFYNFDFNGRYLDFVFPTFCKMVRTLLDRNIYRLPLNFCTYLQNHKAYYPMRAFYFKMHIFYFIFFRTFFSRHFFAKKIENGQKWS